MCSGDRHPSAKICGEWEALDVLGDDAEANPVPISRAQSGEMDFGHFRARNMCLRTPAGASVPTPKPKFRF